MGVSSTFFTRYFRRTRVLIKSCNGSGRIQPSNHASGIRSIRWNAANAAETAGDLPDPTVDAPVAAKSTKQTAVVAGGCFWGIQLVFQHVKGVKNATSGYSGGTVSSPEYEQVGTGRTGHAESVKITFDPALVSYGQLLK